MPELPEVETIRRGLEREIVGRSIERLRVDWPKTFSARPDELAGLVYGVPVAGLDRFSKILVINLENGHSLMFHLKMTGQLVLVKADGERFAGGHPTESMARSLPDRSTRVEFELDNGDILYFNDQRKFGWVKLVPTDQVARDSLAARLGPEPLSDQFTLERFAAEVRRHPGAPVKAIILDQSTVSGVGNIYADESLHMAKVHPATKGAALRPIDVKRLHAAIRATIELGIAHGGTSFTHYVNALGQRGDYLEVARVFRREGRACPVCGSTIEKTRVAGRGTHYCPRCQKIRRSHT